MNLRAKLAMRDSQLYPGDLYLIKNDEFTASVLYFNNSYMFFCGRNAQVNFVVKPQLKNISFKNYKHWYLIHTWSDEAFKDTVVNLTLQSLHGESLEITLTVPLIRSRNKSMYNFKFLRAPLSRKFQRRSSVKCVRLVRLHKLS